GRWRLVSHLTLNRLSLVDGQDGAEALREMLRLYDFRDSSETRGIIDSVLSVSSRSGVARAPLPTEESEAGRRAAEEARRKLGAFCHGRDITVTFAEERFATSGLYLLAMILERFFGHYCAINSFTRMTAAVKGRSEVLRRWPPRAGDLILV